MTTTPLVTSQRTLVDNTLVLNPFKSWLVNKNYSSSTIRNYLSDIDNFLDFTKTSDPFSSQTVFEYLKTISSDPNYSRYLSSLSKFFQFTQDQGLVKTNPLKAALRDKKPNLDEIINQYSEYLNKKNFSESTVRNYLNDIRQFTDWSTNQTTTSTPPSSNPLSFQDISLKKGNSTYFIARIASLFKGGARRAVGLKHKGDL